MQLTAALYIEANSADVFFSGLLKKLADFEIELWFDIYPPDEP